MICLIAGLTTASLVTWRGRWRQRALTCGLHKTHSIQARRLRACRRAQRDS